MAEGAALHVSWWPKEPIICVVSLTALSLGIFLAIITLGGRPFRQTSRPIQWVAGSISVLPIFGAAAGAISAKVPDAAIAAVRDAMGQARLRYLIVDALMTPAQAAPIAARFADNAVGFNGILTKFSVLLITVAVLLGFGLTLCASYADRKHFARLTIKAASLILISLTVLSILSFTLEEPRVLLPQVITPIGILSLFFLMLTAWITFLRVLTKITGWPFLSTLVCAALIFSALDLNDNHKVRTSLGLPNPPERYSDAASEFKKWLKSRSDFDGYSHLKYPVYIVAAQGGGAYAAFHAAGFLADVQDECPNFAHHIFAISGVSGGSIGAAVFASLIRQWENANSSDATRAVKVCAADRRADTLFGDATTEILSRDFLSPLEAGLLFPDFVQQFLFRPVPAFDRSRALEYALEKAWDDAMSAKEFSAFRRPDGTQANPLRESFLSNWNPDSGSSVPALVFNTTEVYSGYRRAVSPFTIRGIDLKFVPVWPNSPVTAIDRSAVLAQMPLSTAAFLSARFPWITPAGWFDDVGAVTDTQFGHIGKIRVVDGGYFENSGLVTAMDVVYSVADAINSDKDLAAKVQIYLITLNSKEYSVRDFYGLSELFAPIYTMLSTRSARAPIETARTQQLLTGRFSGSQATEPLTSFANANFMRFDLNWLGYPLPLGWRLSAVTRLIIDNQLGYRQECPVKTLPELEKMASPSDDCLRELLFEQLVGG